MTTDTLAKLRTELEELNRKVERYKADHAAYRRWETGTDERPSDEVVHRASLYRQATYRRGQVRRAILHEERLLQDQYRLREGLPTHRELKRQVKALLEEVKQRRGDRRLWRKSALLDLASQTMGFVALMPADAADRPRHLRFIDFCLAQIAEIERDLAERPHPDPTDMEEPEDAALEAPAGLPV